MTGAARVSADVRAMILIRRALKSVALGLLMAGLLLVPFLGPFTVGLLLIPLSLVPFQFVRQYCQTGEQVEIGFAWVTLHTLQPFVFFWGYYACLAFAFLSVYSLIRRARESRARS
jgi:ABC-type multidrug transport system permease subunit